MEKRNNLILKIDFDDVSAMKKQGRENCEKQEACTASSINFITVN